VLHAYESKGSKKPKSFTKERNTEAGSIAEEEEEAGDEEEAAEAEEEAEEAWWWRCLW
jgi:hypothetical protein